MITGDGILVWKFVMDGILGKGDRTSLLKSNYLIKGDGRLGRGFLINWRLYKGDIIILNNQ